DGRVSIRWDQQVNGQALSPLVLEWQEMGGPPETVRRSCVRQTAPVPLPLASPWASRRKPSSAWDARHVAIRARALQSVDRRHRCSTRRRPPRLPEGVRCRLELPAGWLSNGSEPVSRAIAPKTALCPLTKLLKRAFVRSDFTFELCIGDLKLVRARNSQS